MKAPLAPTPPAATPPPSPSARARRLARISGVTHPLAPPKTFRPGAAVTDAFLATKRDKRLVKHSSFVARVASSSSSARVTKPPPPVPLRRRRRRRRPGNKLRTSLQGLADALPGLDEHADACRKVRHRSIGSKPGALRRKETVVRGEMERFGATMARLAVQPQPPPDRWASLRGHISATLEQAPAFAAATAPASTS